MLAFQRLYLFILMSGYATSESRQTFRGLARRMSCTTFIIQQPLELFHFSGYIFFS